MANKLDYAKAYQNLIDEEFCATSVTKWMDVNSDKIQFEGGKDISICEVSTTGLGTYDATKTDGTAYPEGAVTNKWRSYSLFMDRGVKFGIDHMAPSDTGFMATAENIIREFSRVQYTREMDTYRLTKIYNTAVNGAYSATNALTGAITVDNAVSELLKTLTAAQTSSEQLSGFMAFVNGSTKNAFMEASAGAANQITFGNRVNINGTVYDDVMLVNDLPCIFVPEGRMVTDVAILSGRDDEKEGGVKMSDTGKYINFIVIHTSAPFAVTKIAETKQFPPEKNQLFDGTMIQIRFLYDLFVPKNKVCAVAVHTQA